MSLQDTGRPHRTTPTLDGDELTPSCPHPKPQGVVWRALWRVHARVMGVTAVIKIVHDAVMFLQPLTLEQLLRHLSGSRHR